MTLIIRSAISHALVIKKADQIKLAKIEARKR